MAKCTQYVWQKWVEGQNLTKLFKNCYSTTSCLLSYHRSGAKLKSKKTFCNTLFYIIMYTWFFWTLEAPWSFVTGGQFRWMVPALVSMELELENDAFYRNSWGTWIWISWDRLRASSTRKIWWTLAKLSKISSETRFYHISWPIWDHVDACKLDVVP